jgi:RNA polymerase sigma factor (sigma-70 family)
MPVEPNSTRASLLVRVRDLSDAAAWGEFVEIYAPLVHRYARRRGLQDADAADIVQEVLREFARCVPRFEYDPAAGRFRGWLHTLTRRAVGRQARQPAARPVPIGGGEAGSPLETAAASAEEAFAEHEYRRTVFEWAARQVRGQVREVTWQAFWLTAVEQVSPAEAASRLGTSVGSVYVAKNRVLTRLRNLVERVDGSD